LHGLIHQSGNADDTTSPTGVTTDASTSGVTSGLLGQGDKDQAPSSGQLLLMGLGYVSVVGAAFLAHGM
jgi:hypothetical protein